MSLIIAFRNLFRNLRRTFAILMTIALGAGALFAFQGFIEGVLSDYKESTIHSHYGHGQINTQNYRDKVYAEPWLYWIKSPQEVESFLQKQEAVDHIFPRVSFSALLKNGKKTINGMGQGIVAQSEDRFFDSLNIESGESLTTQENGILLGKGLAEALGAKPGDKITLYTQNVKDGYSKDAFIVTGIFHTGIVDFDGRIFRIQLNKAQKLLRTDGIESISVGLADESKWKHLVEALKNQFPQLEATYFDELDKVYYKNSVDWLNAQYSIVQGIILSIVLLGIFNSISTSILERRQEVGNLRANGESKWSVIRLVILEGGLLGLGGAVIGISLVYLFFSYCLGDGITMPPGPGSTRSFTATFTFTWQMLALTGSLSMISAVAASAFAAVRVVKMPIAKALRG
ncbi:MAG: ABC transporter permease [Simkaniaceae bacterium]|nr:ABC transporter permease [Simkaniaceae bacterium]MCF7851725.1 ABC transporter permease [Simkaniaceae bacterium]